MARAVNSFSQFCGCQAWLLRGCPLGSPRARAPGAELNGPSGHLHVASHPQATGSKGPSSASPWRGGGLLLLRQGQRFYIKGVRRAVQTKSVGSWTCFQTDHKTNFSVLRCAEKYTFFWCPVLRILINAWLHYHHHAPYSQPFPSQPPATPDLCSVPIGLPFPERPINRVLQYGAF